VVATVGSISIDLSTNLAKFSTGFKSAATTVDQQSARMAKSVNGVERAFRGASGVVAGFVGGIVGGAVVQAVSSFGAAIDRARRSLSDFEEIGNRSRSVGLTASTFQALSLGAVQADVSQEQLNKSLEIFAKNVGLAREGTGALYSGLLKLNPELLKAVLTAGDQEERLKLVADAMRNTADATQKAALANVVFGRGSSDLIRLLDGGAAAIDRFKKEAADLGVIVTDKEIEQYGDLGDKLDKLAFVVNFKLNTALANTGPLFNLAANEAIAALDDINKFIAEIEKFRNSGDLSNLVTLDTIPGSFADSVGTVLQQVVGHLNEGRQAWAEMAAAAGRSTDDINADIIKTLEHIGALQKAGLEPVILNFETEKAQRQLTALLSELDQVKEAARQAGAALTAATAAGGAIGNILGNLLEGAFQVAARSGGKQPGTNTTTNIPGLPTVHRGITAGTTTNQPIDEDVLEDVEEAINEGTDATQTSGEKINRGLDRLGSGIGSHLDSLQETAEVGSAEVADLLRRGIPLNYSSISAAVRTGIITGMDQANLKQYKISTPDTLFPTFGSGDDTETESSRLEAQLERLKLQASTVGSLAADAFAVRISQLELRLFDAKVAEEKSTTDTDLFRKTFGGPSYAGAFADGGSFKVGGNQTGDSNLIMLRANEGETVSVSQGGQRPIILNYHAAAGESEATSRQNARRMLEIAQREMARS
jgi:hypothetical protein